MSKRASKAVLLCEDQQQESLVLAFLKCCGIRSPGRILIRRVASRLKAGGNVGWVLDKFPDELRAVRKRRSKAESLLLVVIDADDGLVDDRRTQLNERAVKAGLAPLAVDAVAILIAKRHIETWIRSLLDEIVTEDQDCKTNKPMTKNEIRAAAQKLFDWSRLNAVPGPSCVGSLTAALPIWRMIGSRLK